MVPVVVAALLASLWLVARAARTPRDPTGPGGPGDPGDRPAGRGSAWLLALSAVVLSGWFAAEELVVGSDELARTVDDVHVVVSDPRTGAPGPVALLSGAELALGTELDMEDLGGYDDGDARITSYEISDRLLGLRVGTACLEGRVVGEAVDGMTSYRVDPGRCE